MVAIPPSSEISAIEWDLNNHSGGFNGETTEHGGSIWLRLDPVVGQTYTLFSQVTGYFVNDAEINVYNEDGVEITSQTIGYVTDVTITPTSTGPIFIQLKTYSDYAGVVDFGISTGSATRRFLSSSPDVYTGASNERIFGFRGDDEITIGNGIDASGGDGDDQITGNAGNNHIWGDQGNDYIHVGDGNDVAWGGAGQDRIFTGGTGFAEIHGGDGADQISISSSGAAYGDAGADHMSGGAAADTLIGGSGGDYINGQQGADTISGDSGNDILYGYDANDLISGGSGTDRVYGGTGDDNIDGGSENDKLYGEDGNDSVIGGAGNDTLSGGVGNDLLAGGSGADYLSGGTGTDRASYTSATSGVIASLANPTINSGDAEGDTYNSIENLSGSYFDDLLNGNGLGNGINGSAGNDIIKGYDGMDILTGGSGMDRFVFNTAPDAGNIDTIVDFDTAADIIQIDNIVFTAFTTVGMLASAAFRANATGLAADASDRIIYETDTGKLFYDRDGSGGSYGGVQFAKLDSGLALGNADIFVI